jgi:DNA-directed RNA polymerase subunit RPC12/RpoP
MHAVSLILSAVLAAATAQIDDGKERAPAQKRDPQALPLAGHLAGLQGHWLLTLPKGFKYQAVLRRLGDKTFRLENAVRFSGDYEVRDDRLVLTKPVQAQDAVFAWELRAAGELTLVAQPRTLNYLGATLRQQDRQEPGPPEVPAPAPPAPKAKVRRPALDLAEHAARLQGHWLLTLPKGFTYQAALRRLDDKRFRLEKAVTFSGDYEIRDNGLARIGSADDPQSPSFVWQLQTPEELTLVAQANAGANYLGATLKQQDAQAPGPPAKVAANSPAPDVDVTGQESRPAGRMPYYLVTALGIVLACAALAAYLLLSLRRPAPEVAETPEPSARLATIAWLCRACGKSLKVRTELAGKRIKCPQCGETLSVPG